MSFIVEKVLHARSADIGDWHKTITRFHAVNQHIANRKEIKMGTERFPMLLSLPLFGKV